MLVGYKGLVPPVVGSLSLVDCGMVKADTRAASAASIVRAIMMMLLLSLLFLAGILRVDLLLMLTKSDAVDVECENFVSSPRILCLLLSAPVALLGRSELVGPEYRSSWQSVLKLSVRSKLSVQEAKEARGLC